MASLFFGSISGSSAADTASVGAMMIPMMEKDGYDRPYHSYPIREDSKHLRTDPAFSYGFQKAEMERYLQAEIAKDQPGAAITILRPSFTFGDGTTNFGILRQNRNVVRRIREGKPVVMTGEGSIPWSFTFAPDLANAFLLSCGNPSAKSSRVRSS